MGILRTDTISGLETPTPVTGSVNFPGSDDYITAPANTPELLLGDADFTIEGWFYKTNTGQQDAFGLYETANNRRSYLLSVGNSSTIFYYNYTGSSGTSVSTGFTLPLNKWAHVAIVRDGTTLKIYVDGKLSGTTTGLTSGAYANTDDQFMIGSSDYSNANGSEWTGYISNLRIVKGYVLYDGDFTVPDHALEVVPGTVLLACNNPDSVTAVESALVGKGLTLTAVNDVAVTSVTPGLTRDFTSGTQFDGVSRFDTQGYFVPPSGTTEQRGRGRAVFGGGTASPGSSNLNSIEFISISTQGNAQDFGDLIGAVRTKNGGGVSSSTRGVTAGGFDTGNVSRIEYVNIATTGNSVDFGATLLTAGRNIASASNSTRGLFAGGDNRAEEIDFITIATLGTCSSFGAIPSPGNANHAGLASPTRAVFGGGYRSGAIDKIEFVTIATLGDAVDFGDLTVPRFDPAACSSPTRGIFAGGNNNPTQFNTIDYITIASTGQAQDFGDLITAKHNPGGTSNSIRGVFAGGSPAYVNTIEFVTIASTGDAKDFGDLITSRGQAWSCSDSHGGIS